MKTNRFYRCTGCLIGALIFTAIGSVSAQDKQASWLQGIRSSNSANRVRAIYELPDKPVIDKAAAVRFLSLLKDSNPAVRKAIVIALGEWKIYPELAVPGLVKLVRDKDESVREHAIVALAKYGSDAAPELIKLLDNTTEEIQPKVYIGKDHQTTLKVSDLAMIGLIDSPSSVLTLLVNAYTIHKTEDYREMIRYVLVRNRYVAVEDLIPYLTSDDPDIRVLALEITGRFHTRAEMALTLVTKLLKDKDERVRKAALETASLIGQAALPIILKTLKESPDSETQYLLIQRISAMDAAGIPVLLEVISNSTDPHIRTEAIRQIPEIGQYTPDVGRILSKAMLDSNPEVASMAAYALDFVCNDSTALSPSDLNNLLDALRSPVGEVQGRAANLLSRQKDIESVKKPAADVIINFLNQLNNTTGNAVEDNPIKEFIHALSSLEPGSSRAILTMKNLLANESLKFLASDIVAVLGGFGPPAKSTVPLILNRLTEIDEYKQVDYFRALANIQPEGMESLLLILRSERYDQETKGLVCQAIGDRMSVNDTVRVQLSTVADQSGDNSFIKIPLAVALYRIGDHSEKVKQILLNGMKSDKQSADIYRGLTKDKHPDMIFLAALWQAAKVTDRPSFLQELITIKGEQIVKDIWLNCLTDPDNEIRYEAVDLLTQSGIESPELPCSTALLTVALKKVISIETSTKKNLGDRSKFQTIFPAIDMIIHMGPEAKSLIPVLTPLLDYSNSDIRQKAAEAIGAIGVDTLQVRRALLKMLGDPVLWVSKTASESLVKLQIDLDSLGVEFSAHVIDNYILSHFSDECLDLADYFRPSHLVSGRFPKGPPAFPWPPPKYSNIARFGTDISMSLIGNENTRLYDVYLKLTKAMKAVDINFESGLFGTPGGIAVLTKMERVNDEGKPLPGKYRWMMGKLPPLSLTDYVGQLFFENAGYFREIAFIFTSEQNFVSSNKTLPDITTGGDFPEELTRTTLKDLHSYVLVYSFKRINGGVLTSFKQVSAAAHLQDSGILLKLNN